MFLKDRATSNSRGLDGKRFPNPDHATCVTFNQIEAARQFCEAQVQAFPPGAVPELKLLFLELAVILIAVRLVAAAFRRVRQPGVVGEMAAGLLLGPSVLGHFAPDALNGLFPPSNIGPLYALSQVGLVLFMFMVGLEIRPSVIRGRAKSVIFASQASIVAPF